MEDKKLDDKTLSFLFRDLGTLKWIQENKVCDETIEQVQKWIFELMSDKQKYKEKEYYEDI